MKELTSLQHPLVKELVKLRSNSSYRHEQRLVFIEGKKMVEETSHYSSLETLFATDHSLIPSSLAKHQKIILVTEEIMKKICGSHNPEGIAATVPMPPPKPLDHLASIVVFDGVSDPGNIGTLLRTALALGWEGAFLIEGSCDPYNDKALRSAKGATFRLPLAFGSWRDLKVMIQKNKWTAYAADLKGVAIQNIAPTEKIVLILGNEARGCSPEARSLSKAITIPMSGSIESLNVAIAGGIIMYELTKKKSASAHG